MSTEHRVRTPVQQTETAYPDEDRVWRGVARGQEWVVDAQIRITGGDDEDLRALARWLGEERELRGEVRHVAAPIGDTELGAITDLLTVAVGTGGAGTVLAQALVTWLRTRRTKAKITVECGGRTVTLDLETTADVLPLLRQVLERADES